MGSHFLLQGIFTAPGSNSCTFHWQVHFYQWTTREACCPIINNYKSRGNKWNNSFSYTGQQAAQACASVAREAMRWALALVCYLMVASRTQGTQEGPSGLTELRRGVPEHWWSYTRGTESWEGQKHWRRILKRSAEESLQIIDWTLIFMFIFLIFIYLFIFWSSCLDETPETEQRITLKQRPLNTQNSNRARAYTRHESSEGNHPHRGDRGDFRLKAPLNYLKKAEKPSSKGSVWFQLTNCVSGQRSILLKEYNNI